MKYERIDYCPECGTKLEKRIMENEGVVGFCPGCKEHWFPVFNAACSMIVLDEKRENALLVKQYGKDYYVLVAGYINRGEEPEATVTREIREETGLQTVSVKYNRSHYFKPNNVLMLNFEAVVKGEMKPNSEIDSYEWIKLEDAPGNMKDGTLARQFMEEYINNL